MDEIEAGGVGVTGLDAVHALVAVHEIVVTAHGAAAEIEACRRKQPVFVRIILHQRDGERRHIARRGHLAAVRQAGGVDEDGAAHTELAGLGRHHPGKTAFRAADVSPMAEAASLADLMIMP